MAITMEGIQKVIAAQKKSGKVYMLMETALYGMEDNTVVEISRTLFQCARGYTEGFTVCGDNACFETGQRDTDLPVVYKYLDNGNFDPERISTVGRATLEERVDPPDRIDLLPRELHRFTRPHQETSRTNPADTYEYTSATGGYHPHVVNGFVLYAAEGKKPCFDLYASADLTAACICAHESAVKGGVWTEIPKYR
jgi:hypothetical protein